MTRWIFLINKALNVLFVFLLFLLYNSTQDNQEIVICRRRRCELGLNVSVKKNNYQLNWKILLFLFCLFVSFLFFFRLTANKVSDYCKLINEEDGHMGDTRVGVWNAGRDYTHKMGGRRERSGMPNFNTESARQDDCVCERHNSCQIERI
jgi:hypothetical protein